MGVNACKKKSPMLKIGTIEITPELLALIASR
jgi:hypothetical protein